MITEFKFKDRTVTIKSEAIANAYLHAICARIVARSGWFLGELPVERIEARPNGNPFRDRRNDLRTPVDAVRVFDFGEEHA